MTVPRSTFRDPIRIDTARSRRGAIALAIAVLMTMSIAAHAEDTASAAPSPVDLLRRMSATLKDAETFRFHAEINFDDVLISGQKVQYAGAADITVRRPNGVFVDYRDDLSAKRFWYDGETGTLLDVVQSLYSTAALPANLDAAMHEMKERYKLRLPLGELISSDLFAVIESKALAWGYLGIHDVEGTPAHHIAITGDDADLQVWIQTDKTALPLKFVVTYKTVPQAPQYQAVLMDWKIDARVSDKTFEPALPKGARKIEFLVAEDGK
jgi:hypothetical protein